MFKSTAKKRSRLNRSDQRVERTRQILEAAWAIYCEKGYEGATIEDIAEHAGISRMPIYSLFGDKQNLYFELSSQLVGNLQALMLGPLKAGAPLRRNLEKLARIACTRPKEVPSHIPESLFYVVQVIALSRPDIGKKQQEQSKQVIDAFAQMIRSSALLPGEQLRATPEVIAAHIVAQMNGLATVQLHMHRHFVKPADLIALFYGLAFKTDKA